MPKTNLKTLAYNTIRQKIVTCEYAPGTFLNEEILTEDLGLSRTPIRDALGRLEQEGLIQIKSKKGITVMPLSVSTIHMIFEVRLLYEPYILLHYGASLPKERLEKFYAIFLCKSSESKRFRDKAAFYELDSDFHFTIVNACPNIYIRQNYAMIQTQNERFRHMTGNVSDERLDETFREHADIVRPCLVNDWETAAEKLTYHIEKSREASFQLIFHSLDPQEIRL